MSGALATNTFDDDRPAGAPHLVMVHGVMDRATSFGRVVGYLHDVVVVTYDRRGYANSSHVEPSTELTDQVEDLLAVIGDSRASIVGHSMGGVLALMAAQRRADLVASVGVYEPPMPWLDWWPQTTAGAQAAAEAADPAQAAERFLRALAGDEAWETLPMRTQAQRRAEGPALVADVEAIRATAPPFDVAAVKPPVAVASGSATRAHHVRGTAELGELFGVSVRTIDGAGHNGHQSHPREFASFCREVLALGA